MNDLELYREQLALCDEKLIEDLTERSDIFEKMLEYKEEHGMLILQPMQREKRVKRLEEKLKGNPYKEEIMNVFSCIAWNWKRIQGKKLFPHNIVLTGFMGTGKTTLAEYMGERFAMDVVEMDKEIENRAGMSVEEIFSQYGEEHFRQLETELLEELQSREHIVISCGGGIVLREENIDKLKKQGKVVLLTASAEVILERVKENGERPLLKGNKNIEWICKMMEERADKYAEVADVTVNTDGKTVLQICEEMIQKLEER
ncbi:hypothetical protein HMPREF9477_01180 [Lachnospiraceae bacterium 2_1_46FAA]|jgi:shikimate kinase/chorismate mutase|nr:hypothetical protein HMPREF9477_01180 [Lachnospiraceae bacterium 2_1_46FAA]